ncbi:MAG: hypothetical protein ACRCTZ_06335 [Sarcina sp.]
MKRDNMKTRVVSLILIVVVATVSLGIYMIHKREARYKRQVIINETNAVSHDKNTSVNITVQKDS